MSMDKPPPRGQSDPRAVDVGLGDERRDSLRIDDELLLEYRLEGEPDQTAMSSRGRISDDDIATFFAKPTTDFLSHQHGVDGDGKLGQWLMKIDWALEMILKALARLSPGGVQLPSMAEVNLSEGGLRFASARAFQESDVLDINLILPPFTPITAKAEVTRVTQESGERRRVHVAARFVSIAPEDRERLIRHILLLQAERIRARQGGGPSSSLS